MGRKSRQFLVYVIAVGLQYGDFREVIEQDIALSELIRCDGTMIIVDIPIKFQQDFLVLIIVTGGKGARIKAVFGLENAYRPIHLRLIHTRNVIDCLRVRGHCGLELLVIGEEEQLVLDDRATERKTICIFLEIANAQAHAIRFVASKTVVRRKVVSTAVELVGSRLGYDVDIAADKVSIGHVKRSDIDVDFLNRIDGNRRTLPRGSVLGQSEIVILRHAVNGHTVETEVLTSHRHRGAARHTVVNKDSWIGRQRADKVAPDRGGYVDLVTGKISADADADFRCCHFRSNDDFLDNRPDSKSDDLGPVQFQIDILQDIGRISARVCHLNLIGAADRHAARCSNARIIRGQSQ